MPHLPTDFPLTVWPCYEPAGHRVELTEADLVQHILLIGSTGSGKSTLLIDTTPAVDRSSNPVEQLAAVRSKRCFVLAASQGLHSLAKRVGVGQSLSLRRA